MVIIDGIGRNHDFSGQRLDVPELYYFILRRSIMIKKTKSGYIVTSEKGKKLGGPYRTKQAAQKRLRQVEYFKHKK